MSTTNPHLNHNFHDEIHQVKHCADCEKPLVQRELIIDDHVLGVWRHHVWTNYPGVLATDERGMTIEGVFAQPPRRVLALVPIQNSIYYCPDCFPFPDLHADGCGKCGTSINTLQEEHTQVELLWKDSQERTIFKQTVLHIDCLPAQFDPVRQVRDKRKSN